MDIVISDQVIQEIINEYPAVTAVVVEQPVDITVASIPSEIKMYKTQKGNDINIGAIAEAARSDLKSVQLIDVPAIVRRYRIRNTEYEAPTLSECGGGRVGFGQVIAGRDGRPVEVGDVYRINTDPTRLGARHATVSVGLGNYFSVGWTKKSDLVILVYEIVAMGEYDSDKNQPTTPVAKLTSRLVAHEISSWRHNSVKIPEFLMGLVAATRMRLRNDVNFPFYVDMFRPVAKVPAEHKDLVFQIILDNTTVDFPEFEYESLMQLMREILDIRYCQYAEMPSDVSKRRAEPLYLIETLMLDSQYGHVDISITPVRTDGPSATIRFRLTENNFIDENGAMSIERRLVLNNTTFERLKLDLENDTGETKVVHLLSLR